MRRAALVALALTAVLFVVGVDLLHCLVVGAVALTIGLLLMSLEPVEESPEPDPLPIPFATTLLRSITFTDPRSADPLGDAAGRRALQIFDQAAHDFPDDPVLARYAARPPDAWRFLPQRELVALLDRIDALARPESTGSALDRSTDPARPASTAVPTPRPEETR